MTRTLNRLPDFSSIPELRLAFDPVDLNKTDTHPLRGLAEHGPYGHTISPGLVPSPIRLGFVSVEGHASRLRDFLNDLQTNHDQDAKSGYFPKYPGFTSVFRSSLEIPQNRQGPVSLISRTEIDAALASSEPERVLMGLIETAISKLLLRRQEFDVLILYFPSFLSHLFLITRDQYDFNLHFATKALTASLSIPSQVVIDRSIDYKDRNSVMWSLSLALYTKAGGIPWKLSTTPSNTVYVGLSYVLRRVGERTIVLTCCSQVFDDRGHGIEFLLFTADEVVFIRKNPFLTRSDMRRLLSKTLELYVRQTGHQPRNVIVHKTTHFSTDERAGAAEALGGLERYELLQIQEETGWLATKGQRQSPTAYPVNRGTVLPISKYSYLLWTQGDAFGAARSGESFYQEAKGIPCPLLITQHAGHTPMVESAANILGLTKMNWNTGRLYNELPVTIKSASALGQIAKYMTRVSQKPYQFRLFM